MVPSDTVVAFSQFSKADAPKFVMPVDKAICDNDLQLAKPADPMVFREVGKSIFVRFTHPLNASFPMDCKPSFNPIEHRFSQFANALDSISITVIGIRTDVTRLFLNAEFEIDVTVRVFPLNFTSEGTVISPSYVTSDAATEQVRSENDVIVYAIPSTLKSKADAEMDSQSIAMTIQIF